MTTNKLMMMGRAKRRWSLVVVAVMVEGYDFGRLGHIGQELVERATLGAPQRSTRTGKEQGKSIESVRSALMRTVAATGRVPRDEVSRLRVEAACYALEAAQKKRPELSAIDGRWRVAYSTAPFPSNGKLGPFEFEAVQTVDVARKRYDNELVGLTTLQASFEGNSERLRVKFEKLRILDFEWAFPDGVERTWRLAYTDDEVRVVRASVDGGKRVLSRGSDDAEAVFVLIKDRGAPAALKKQLLDAVSENNEAEIRRLINALHIAAPATGDMVAKLLPASYKVLWTTESELNALTRLDSCRGAYQTVDIGSLDNLVDFQDGSFLSVASTCEPRQTRVDFQFKACTAQLAGFKFPLPPVGAGYFDVLYIDSDLRVSRDSRGDLQVTARKPLDAPHPTISSPP